MNNSKVNVAVRVRPLNQREERLNSECVVQVSGNKITLLPPISCKEKDRKEPHIFTYDNCFWTEDRHDTGQEDVFEHLGDGALENIWLGYNVCIFAYGQTGSGKTFSMMGTDDQPGIVPRICSALFNKESNDLETIRIEACYFEIYNEEVRDLLGSEKKQKKLRVREHRLLGPYVEELSCHAVRSYGEIKLLLDQGNKQRTIAETKMNEQSSRSHSILTLTVTQICNDRKSGASRELVSKVSLVDLAGSERSYKSGAQGNQLKECCNINKSLLTLGLVINSLAETSENKRKCQHVNYRDSVLTWLLKNNLGGNSKTIMLATVSPAADNYQETLSTLRYADSAKRIVNQAVVNKDVKSKAMEELQEEIKRLREQITTTEQVKAEVQELKSQMEEKENLLRDLKTSWEEKLKRTEVATQEWQKNLEHMGIILKKQNVTFSNQCYLIQRSMSLIIHNINDVTKIGSGPSQDIQISGAEAECEHCEIWKTEGEVFLIAVNNSKTYVNGCLSKNKTQLWHEDKIQIGNTVFILHHPSRPKPDHIKTNVSSEAEVQTYDELNTENDRSSISSERDGWNSNMIENEKSKTKSAFYKATESSAPTIPASDDGLNSSEKKQTSDMFTEISNKSNSQPIDMKVNTAKSEYLEIGVDTKVQDFTVPCSPQYGEASSQTSEMLRNNNCLQSTPDLEDHANLSSDTIIRKECRERLAVFTWNPKTDVTPLLKLLSELSVFEYWSVCGCISHLAEDKWKSYVDGSSIIFLYHSHSPETPLPDLSCLKKFLDYSREKHGSENIKVVIADVEDINWERKITEWWMAGKYRDWELLTLSKAEMRLLIKHKINPLSAERRMAHKLRHIQQILQEAAEEYFKQVLKKVSVMYPFWANRNFTARSKYTLGIFSRSAISDYSWITELLHSDQLGEHVSDVRYSDISNDPISTGKCTFGILYFTKKRGQINEMDAKDVQLIQQYRRHHGKDNLIIVVDDVEDSSDQEKIRILESHPDKEELYHNLFLFSQQEKSSEYRTLLSSLLNINEPRQLQESGRYGW